MVGTLRGAATRCDLSYVYGPAREIVGSLMAYRGGDEVEPIIAEARPNADSSSSPIRSSSARRAIGDSSARTGSLSHTTDAPSPRGHERDVAAVRNLNQPPLFFVRSVEASGSSNMRPTRFWRRRSLHQRDRRPLREGGREREE